MLCLAFPLVGLLTKSLFKAAFISNDPCRLKKNQIFVSQGAQNRQQIMFFAPPFSQMPSIAFPSGQLTSLVDGITETWHRRF